MNWQPIDTCPLLPGREIGPDEPQILLRLVNGKYIVVVRYAEDDDGGCFYDNSENEMSRMVYEWEVIGLNPSTATELVDDPTVRRCRRFAERWGYGGFVMLNLFAFRATDPRDMKREESPEGNLCDRYILEGAFRSQEIVCCWGIHGQHRQRAAYVEQMLRPGYSEKLRYLRLVSGGIPGHPLYLPNAATREVWDVNHEST